MNRTQLLLFASTVFIWGSTWYAIKFQLGVVDPLVSVAWRFFAASALIFLVCRLIGVSLRLTPAQHRWAVLQGISLFGLNYCLFYIATGYLTTGLIAVSFSTMVIWNILGAGLWFKSQVPIRVVVGACVGFCGVVLLFMPDVFRSDLWAGRDWCNFPVFSGHPVRKLWQPGKCAKPKSRNWSVAGECLGHAVWRDCNTGHGDRPR